MFFYKVFLGGFFGWFFIANLETNGPFFYKISSFTVPVPTSRVADLDHFSSNPDPAFHKLCRFGPGSGESATTVLETSRAPVWASMLLLWVSRLLNCDFNADSDPDPASKIMRLWIRIRNPAYQQASLTIKFTFQFPFHLVTTLSRTHQISSKIIFWNVSQS